MFLCLLGEISCVSVKYVYYGYPEIINETLEDTMRVYIQRHPGDKYFEKLCTDAAKAFSVINYENKVNETKTINVSEYDKAFNHIFYDFYTKHNYTVDLTHASDMDIVIKSRRGPIINILSNETDLTDSIPFLYFYLLDVNFTSYVKLNTVYFVNCYSVHGTFEAKNLITSNLNDFSHRSQLKIFYPNNHFPSSIIFNEDNITLTHKIKNSTINKNISLMLSPYRYESAVIDMILAPNVTRPMSLKIYFEDPDLLTYIKIFDQYFELEFYDQNKYIRNATIGFKFIGEWEKVQNFTLDLLATENNQKFINTTGFPQNITYTLKNDELFNISFDSPTSTSSTPMSASGSNSLPISPVSSGKRFDNLAYGVVLLLMTSIIFSYIM